VRGYTRNPPDVIESDDASQTDMPDNDYDDHVHSDINHDEEETEDKEVSFGASIMANSLVLALHNCRMLMMRMRMMNLIWYVMHMSLILKTTRVLTCLILWLMQTTTLKNTMT
jgi:hypothetical protein